MSAKEQKPRHKASTPATRAKKRLPKREYPRNGGVHREHDDGDDRREALDRQGDQATEVDYEVEELGRRRLAEEINRKCRRWALKLSRGIKATIELGNALIEAKRKVGVTRWKAFVGDYLDLSLRQVQRIMRLARKAKDKEVDVDGQLSPTAALGMLAIPRDPKVASKREKGFMGEGEDEAHDEEGDQGDEAGAAHGADAEGHGAADEDHSGELSDEDDEDERRVPGDFDAEEPDAPEPSEDEPNAEYEGDGDADTNEDEEEYGRGPSHPLLERLLAEGHWTFASGSLEAQAIAALATRLSKAALQLAPQLTTRRLAREGVTPEEVAGALVAAFLQRATVEEMFTGV